MQHVTNTTDNVLTMDNLNYENSIFYLINSCSKYFNMLFEQFIKKLNLGVSGTEHLALKIISETSDCSQRDLAKLILKDRANTGKLALSLEKKGLIKIELKTKRNRPVKILTVTNKGLELCQKVSSIIEPIVRKIYSEISIELIEETKKTIKNFRKIIEDTIKINI